ncbi:DpnI domain-containing protein [Frisingicoccus sp.]|uniref:DpnI domain-containing protein n=1 Tax=Frisingicoccus sp. TaxID=1918627 RepID=UPI003AB6834F
MNLKMDDKIAEPYKSNFQKIRVITEQWVNNNFFFMSYNKQDLQVRDFLMVPKYFFSPEIIEKRKPLSDT